MIRAKPVGIERQGSKGKTSAKDHGGFKRAVKIKKKFTKS
jgi:hypothetical protein